jgi:Flp pilus assembly protein TadG
MKTPSSGGQRRGRRLLRRRTELGQMVPLMAIFAVVLIGCTAIATDLSVSTHYKRSLQSVTDGAALAGARQLPAKITSATQATAVEAALKVIHNEFPWSTSGSWASNLVNAGGCGDGVMKCSVTVCAGLTSANPPCTAGYSNVNPGTNPAFYFTVDTPPSVSSLSSFTNSDLSQDPHYYQRVEVVMHQKSGAFFGGIFGVGSEQDGAISIAYHFAPDQAFPFALFSNTVIGDGNSPEIIEGNVYADRYLAPQGNGQAAICAAPDPNNNPGYIVLGSPQGGDSGYQKDGQYNDSNVPPASNPILDGFSPCSAIGAGEVGMSANPVNSAGCAAAFAGDLGGSTLTFNSYSDACEATPPLAIPAVQGLPNIPTYSTTQCVSNPTTGTVLDPTLGAYQCNANGAPSLTINSNVTTMKPGIYEILPSKNTGGCDVSMDGTFTQLTGVTFYLEQGAGICANPASGVTIYQTPYCASSTCPGSAAPGDGVYDVLSDNVGNPSITMNTAGGGSTSGVWSLDGVIWLPTGTASIGNKNALADDGQILVNTWNDTSGYHQDPSVIFNGEYSPGQKEVLELVQ